jgi:hypothetical protein
MFKPYLEGEIPFYSLNVCPKFRTPHNLLNSLFITSWFPESGSLFTFTPNQISFYWHGHWFIVVCIYMGLPATLACIPSWPDLPYPARIKSGYPEFRIQLLRSGTNAPLLSSSPPRHFEMLCMVGVCNHTNRRRWGSELMTHHAPLCNKGIYNSVSEAIFRG